MRKLVFTDKVKIGQLGLIFLLAFLYFFVGKFAFILSIDRSLISTIAFFSEGIALAFVILFGYRVVIGSFVAILLLGLTEDLDMRATLGLAILNSSLSLMGAWLFHYFKFDKRLYNIRDVLFIVALSIFIIQPVSAFGSNLIIYSYTNLDGAQFLNSITIWWIGNVLGQIVVTPLILTFVATLKHDKYKIHYKEVIFWCLLGLINAFLIFQTASYLNSEYKIVCVSLLFPFFIYLGLKTNLFVSSLTTFLVCILTYCLTVFHYNAGLDHIVFSSFIELDVFLILLQISTLLIVVFIEDERRMLMQINKRESQYRLLFENMSNAFILGKIKKDSYNQPVSFTIVFTNKKFQDIFNISENLSLGKDFKDIINAQDLDAYNEFCKQGLQGKPFVGEYYSNTIQHYFTIRSFNPEENYIAIILDDITEKVLAEQERIKNEQIFRSVFYNSNIGICIADTNGNLKTVNNEMCKITGYSKEELEKMTVNDIALKEDLSLSSSFIKDSLANISIQQNNFEKRYRHKNGHVIKCVVSSSLIRNEKEEPLYFISHVRDVTIRRQQEELLELNSQKLKDLNHTKDKFFGIIAHDLKNPFHNILGFSDLLAESVKDYNTEKTLRYLNFIKSSAENAHNLLENLLEWSRSQSGAIEFKPEELSINDVFEHIISELENSTFNKEIKIYNKLENEISAFGDLNMINTILRNLISNAIKFTNRGGEIQLQAILKDEYVYISVQDNGIGIKQDKINKLFKISENISTSGTEKEKGTGLGLILCKEFVEKHSGEIFAESELNKGSTFCFSLPVYKSS
jgi:PAS domain S-box-containing protein